MSAPKPTTELTKSGRMLYVWIIVVAAVIALVAIFPTYLGFGVRPL